ncbi:MAG: hypothetical protein UT33_C0005G0053 [Candidatus Peregrinibacteria bacterium GW2011_GWC2_39_14]|nr:MAG: hypothetical protein US92_C0001G0053 [Candidatus Peregrinibacteria bacterium GW2011_GWA2_38_36]KKR07109.1 MAG: hypothetical protein UT33_C0005G0053 [Candidatus Peregrinibacteria bacterium GW2011_GWC2_39_14]
MNDRFEKPYGNWTDDDKALAAGAIADMLDRGKLLTPQVENIAARLLTDFSARLHRVDDVVIEVEAPAEADDDKVLAPDPSALYYFESLKATTGVEITPSASPRETIRALTDRIALPKGGDEEPPK